MLYLDYIIDRLKEGFFKFFKLLDVAGCIALCFFPGYIVSGLINIATKVTPLGNPFGTILGSVTFCFLGTILSIISIRNYVKDREFRKRYAHIHKV